MNRPLQKLSLAALSVSLCACSLLGERKDSTRLDLESEPLAQLKILAKKAAIDSDENGLDQDGSLESLGASNLRYEFKFLHPSKTATNYILEKNINLSSVSTGRPQGRDNGVTDVFTEMDRPQMFFDLGGKIAGNLDIVEPNTENLEKIAADVGEKVENLPYSEQKSNELQAKLVELDASCDGNTHSIIAKGSAKVDLGKVDLAPLNLNVEQRQEIQNKTKSLDQITPMPFATTLLPDQQNQMYVAFDPKLDEFTITVIQYIEACLKPGGASHALISTPSGIQQVASDQIKINGDRVTIQYIDNDFKKEELKTYKISNGKTLEEITFKTTETTDDGQEIKKRNPVFTQPVYKQVSTLTFLMRSRSEADPETEVKPEGEVSAPTNETPAQDPEAKAPTPIVTQQQATAHPSQVETPKIQLPSDKKIKVEDFTPVQSTYPADSSATKNSAVADSSKTKVVAPADSSSVTKRDSSSVAKPAIPTPNFSVESMKSLKSLFSAGKTWFKTSWFNPTMLRHSKDFYTLDEGKNKFVYSTGDYNSRDFSTDYFQEFGKSDDEVNAACNTFEYQRTLTIPVEFNAPREYGSSEYYTLSKQNSKGQTFTRTLSYKDVLKDQFTLIAGGEPTGMNGFLNTVSGVTGETVFEKTLRSAIEGIMSTPANLKKQTFTIKVCFDGKKVNGKKKFKTFWTSSESRQIYKVDKKGYADVTNAQNPKPWFESQWEEATHGKEMKKFITRKPPVGVGFSDFNIECRSDTDCYGVFNLTFRRKLPVQKVMAYINESKLSDNRDAFMNPLMEVKDGKEQVIQNEIIVFGGFALDTLAAKADAKYITPEKLKAAGLIDYNSGSIQDAIYSTFPGELAEMYLRIVPTQSADVASNVLASK